MKNIFIITAICLIFIARSSCYAQQTAVFADYYHNPLMLNPAISGFYANSDFTLSGRINTGAVEGAPETMSLTYHTPIDSKKMGLGAIIINDKVGVSTKTSFYGTYAFKLISKENRMSESWYYSPTVLSLGLSVGVSKYTEDLLSLDILNDPEFQSNINETIPSVGIGFLYNEKTFYLGLSTNNLLKKTTSSENNINIKNHYYLNSGYRAYISRFSFVEPSILLKYVNGAPMQIDINCLYNYHNKYEFGIGYRTTNTVNLLAGFYLGHNFRFIYNYSPAIGNSPLGHSHGLILSYRFGTGYINNDF